jgi:hypothetical protein
MSSPSSLRNTAADRGPSTVGSPVVRHFIITRFNLRSSDPSSARMIDEGYLAQRLDLFERFCLPTVRNQSRQDFKWLVLFAEDTPAIAKARIEHYAEWPNFMPVYLPAGLDHVGRLVVRPYLDGSAQTLITTRIDNDDGLCRNYIEKVRRFESTTERVVVQFPVGFVWHRDRIYLDRQEHNAFTTLIEPLPAGSDSEFFTIYKGSHSEIQRLGRVIDADDEPGWLQVIHGTNLENYVRGRRQRIDALPQRFDVEVPASAHDESSLEIGFDRVRTFATSTATRMVRSIRFRLGRNEDH